MANGQNTIIKAVEGDTAEAVAKRFQLTPERFSELNPDIGDTFDIGQEINVPGAEAAPALLPEQGGPVVEQPDIPGGEGGDGDVIDSADSLRDETDQLGADIKTGLEQFGIEQPGDETDPLFEDLSTQLGERRTQLEERRKQDIERTGKEFDAAAEELDIQQEEALAKAEGRTRIGGFFTMLEAEDILRMQRQHRLEDIALRGQRQEALREANRAFEDNDFRLAREQLQLAKDAEIDQRNQRQQYFDNVRQFTQLSTPMSRATDAMRAQVEGWMQKYPDAFLDVSPAELVDMSTNEAYRRVLESDIFKTEQESPDRDTQVVTVGGRKVLIDSNTGKTIKDLGSSTEDGGGVTTKLQKFRDFIADNPTLSREELKAKGLELKVSVSQVNAELDKEGITKEDVTLTGDQITTIATAIVKKSTKFLRGGEVERAKELISTKKSITSGGKTFDLSARQIQQILDAIDAQFPEGKRSKTERILPGGN